MVATVKLVFTGTVEGVLQMQPDGSGVITFGSAPAPTPEPAPAPTPTPVPTPTPQPVPPVGSYDYDLDAMLAAHGTNSLQPPEGIQANGDSGAAIKFTADATKFPNGISIRLHDQGADPSSKQAVISQIPHDFEHPVSSLAVGVFGSDLSFPLRFGTTPLAQDIPLTPGGVYYVNFRSADVPRVSVATQIVVYQR